MLYLMSNLAKSKVDWVGVLYGRFFADTIADGFLLLLILNIPSQYRE